MRPSLSFQIKGLLTAFSQEQSYRNFFQTKQFAETINDESLISVIKEIGPINKHQDTNRIRRNLCAVIDLRAAALLAAAPDTFFRNDLNGLVQLGRGYLGIGLLEQFSS